MRAYYSTRFAAMAALISALACAGNTAREDTDESAAARDTTSSDTLGGDQNQPGYRGMERDTSIAPTADQQPSDTFLQNQGVGGAQDTSGYSGMERTDTTGQANSTGQTDPASGQSDTSSMGRDTSRMGQDTSSTSDTSWTKSGDTTGYNPSQEPQDSVSR